MQGRRTRQFTSAVGAFALVAGSLMVLLAAPATAATFQVTNGNNTGSGSLRKAFADAAASGGEIDVAVGLGTITLTSGPISYVANGDIAVIGNGVTVDGNGGDGVIHKTAGTGALSLDGITITGSNATSGSVVGAVAVQGTGAVSLSNCAFTGNHQTSSVIGSDIGALVLSSPDTETLTVTNCTFTDNVSTATMTNNDIAGAIDWDADGDSATITGSVFSGNTASTGGNAVVAGAIDSEGGPLTITGSSINDNHATATNGSADVSGGVVSEGGEIVVQYTSITNNSGTGGAVSLNIGAAMNNEGGPETLLNVTASNNTSTVTTASTGATDAGAGVGRRSRVHDTAVNNVSAAGWLNYGGEASLVYVTMTGNSGATNAIYNAGNYLNGGGTASFFGTAIGDPQNGPNCTLYPGDTTFVSNGYNAEDDAGASCGFSASTHDKVGDPLGLAALADNGAPGLTQLPQAGSVLLDAIPPASCQNDGADGVTTDERGVTRPQGPGCEIGAVEVELVTPAPPLTPVTPAPLVVAPKFTG